MAALCLFGRDECRTKTKMWDRNSKKKCGYLLQMMEMATRETIKTTPAAADPAIRGSCSLSSDLKSSVFSKGRRQRDRCYEWLTVWLNVHDCVYLQVCKRVCICEVRER